MNSLMLFLHIIAWVVGVITTLFGCVSLYYQIKYPGSLEEIIDKLNGIRGVYRPLPFLIVALICWAFIIAF